MTRAELYPPIEPFDVQRLALDNIHTIRIEQSGKRDGTPVLFLHGGPASGLDPNYRRFFDPDHYRVIAFTQRGSPGAEPVGELRANTPAHLIADIERIRRMFGIERWIVFGGSWGSTLSLLYATHHRERCAAVIVRGISFSDTVARGWSFRHSRWVRPEAWEHIAAVIPDSERDDIEGAMARRILSDDPKTAQAACDAWNSQAIQLGRTRHPDPDLPPVKETLTPQESLATARVAMAYFHNHLFMEPGWLRAHLHRLAGIPGAILQGTEDFQCPPANAYDLHCAWPDATYREIEDAGHSCFDVNMRKALVETMEGFKRLEA